MTFTVARFNLVDPDATPETLAARYRAALEMAAYADDPGVDTIQTEEQMYASWQSKDIRSAVRSKATTVEELRDKGVYRIVTPDECVALGGDSLVLHPLCGGMPVDEGWRSLQLFAESVLPRLTS